MFRFAEKQGFYLCNTDGKAISWPVSLRYGTESIWNSWVQKLETQLRRDGSETVLDCLSFKDDVEVLEREAREGKDNKYLADNLSSLWNWGCHKLPLFFSRASYIIDVSTFEIFKLHNDDPHFPYGHGYGPAPEVAPLFSGCSVCVENDAARSFMHENFLSIFGVYLNAALSGEWDKYHEAFSVFGPKGDGSQQAKRRRGAKPSKAKEKFKELYPNGKPEDVSADAIAAELRQLGFDISSRSILNYAKESNN